TAQRPVDRQRGQFGLLQRPVHRYGVRVSHASPNLRAGGVSMPQVVRTGAGAAGPWAAEPLAPWVAEPLAPWVAEPPRAGAPTPVRRGLDPVSPERCRGGWRAGRRWTPRWRARGR